MSNLFLKDESLLTSPPILGYKILEYMESAKLRRISIFDIADHFKTEHWFSTKNLYFAMMFLFSLEIIDFQHSYITRIEKS